MNDLKLMDKIETNRWNFNHTKFQPVKIFHIKFKRCKILFRFIQLKIDGLYDEFNILPEFPFYSPMDEALDRKQKSQLHPSEVAYNNPLVSFIYLLFIYLFLSHSN